MKVSDIGEFGLIARITEAIATRGTTARVGIGDDTAVLSISPGKELLATVDVMVEGVHFRPGTTNPYLLGARALTVNLSDIAAMGGEPRYALVSLGLPPDTEVEFVDELYRGMLDRAGQYGTEIVGGNITDSPQVIIDVTLLGEQAKGRPLLRSGSRVGDTVMVTGTLGDSAAGLALLTNPDINVPGAAAEFVIERHRNPTPRIKAGQALAACGCVAAMMDISDGIASDAWRICEASHVGIILNAANIPISTAAREVVAATGRDALSYALFGGEDYELLITVAPGKEEEAERAVQSATGPSLTRVGEVVGSIMGVMLRLPDGTLEELPPAGYQHLRRKKE